MRVLSLAILIVFGFLLFLFPSSQARANCWATYDESYRSSLQSSMGGAVASHVGNFSNKTECEDYLSQMLSRPEYSGDAGLRKTTCECSTDSGGESGSSVSSAATSEDEVAANLATATVGGLIYWMGHMGPTPEDLAKQKWTKEEKDRYDAEHDRNNKIYADALKDSVSLLGNRPIRKESAPVFGAAQDKTGYFGMGTVPMILRKTDAAQAAEWEAVGVIQRRIDSILAILKERKLTPEEIKEWHSLEAKRDALWAKAVTTPGMDQTNREALKVRLPMVDANAPTLNDHNMIELRQVSPEIPITKNEDSKGSSSVDGTQGSETATLSIAERRAQIEAAKSWDEKLGDKIGAFNAKMQYKFNQKFNPQPHLSDSEDSTPLPKSDDEFYSEVDKNKKPGIVQEVKNPAGKESSAPQQSTGDGQNVQEAIKAAKAKHRAEESLFERLDEDYSNFIKRERAKMDYKFNPNARDLKAVIGVRS
jgi:hypothetical protein